MTRHRIISDSNPRIPAPVENIQVNFCKNPQCANFGVPASMERQPHGRESDERGRDFYTIGTAHRVKVPALICSYCGQTPPIKSNLGIYEELSRFNQYLLPAAIPSCPSESCSNHAVPMNTPGAYQHFGKTKSGNRRMRCKECGRAFSLGSATLKQKKPHKNATVFRLLMNKVPFKRICDVASISMPTLYDKIQFLHRQCLAFVSDRERALPEKYFRRLYIAVDRQDYIVNWTDASDKRNVQLHTVGSADNTTGYVFGLHLNFDPSLQPTEIEKQAISTGEYLVTKPFRRYARLWLKDDYEQAVAQNQQRERPILPGTALETEVQARYAEASSRSDIESLDRVDENVRFPLKGGVQVHAEYTLYGHFFFLRKLFENVEKVRFFLDQDSGMRAACLSAFVDRIREDRCDTFYVSINADLTIDEKRQLVGDNKHRMAALKAVHPGFSENQIKLKIIKEKMGRAKSIGRWQDRWVRHPFPNMGEPEKAVCYLTDIHGYDEDHVAWLYNKASLHGIDRFFMQVRRRLSLLERPISSASSAGRKWHGYNPYRPVMIGKVLDIFRVFYNYVEAGKDGQTPAMRLGLAKGKVDVEDVIYHQ